MEERDRSEEHEYRGPINLQNIKSLCKSDIMKRTKEVSVWVATITIKYANFPL